MNNYILWFYIAVITYPYSELNTSLVISVAETPSFHCNIKNPLKYRNSHCTGQDHLITIMRLLALTSQIYVDNDMGCRIRIWGVYMKYGLDLFGPLSIFMWQWTQQSLILIMFLPLFWARDNLPSLRHHRKMPIELFQKLLLFNKKTRLFKISAILLVCGAIHLSYNSSASFLTLCGVKSHKWCNEKHDIEHCTENSIMSQAEYRLHLSWQKEHHSLLWEAISVCKGHLTKILSFTLYTLKFCSWSNILLINALTLKVPVL